MKHELGDDWKQLTDIDDNDKIFTGILVRIYGVGLNVKNKNDDFYDYILSEIYNEEKLLQFVCLSKGEEGNILCVIKKHDDENAGYALGSEIKRMLNEGKYNVFVKFNPKIKVI